jgi:hypothetical protein
VIGLGEAARGEYGVWKWLQDIACSGHLRPTEFASPD